MPKYFQYPDGSLSPLLVEAPANPEDLPIVELHDPIEIPVPLSLRREIIERERERDLSAGYLHSDGHTYPSDDRFQSQLSSFVLAWNIGVLDNTQQVQIRRQDNVTVSMTKAEVMALAGGLMAHVQSIWAASWAAKDALQ